MSFPEIQSLLFSGCLEVAASRLARVPLAEAAGFLSEIDPCTRFDLFRSISGRDQDLCVKMMAALREDLMLELAAEGGLAATATGESSVTGRSLLDCITSRMPEVLSEIRLFAYDISGQNVAGTESVLDIRSRHGWRVVATRTHITSRSGIRDTRLLLYDGAPIRYRALLNQAELASAVFDKARVSWSVGTSRGVRNREMTLSDEVFVLDTFVWHHFSMLTEGYRIAERGGQRVDVFVPSIGRRISAVIELLESSHRVPGQDGQLRGVYRVIFPGNTVVQICVGPKENPTLILENDQRLLALGREIFI